MKPDPDKKKSRNLGEFLDPLQLRISAALNCIGAGKILAALMIFLYISYRS
jgi:hypothetical protein